MAEVYWIRSISHTDIFSQGYVGVTTKTALERFNQHIKTARVPSSKKSIIHKVIKSYGTENLVVETVCICEESYAYDLEFKLRPKEFIGWNQIVGGTKPPSNLGKSMSDSAKAKISLANSGPASPAKLEALLKNSKFKTGYLRDEASKKKHSETLAANRPWNNPAANKSFWANAEKFYQDFCVGLTIVDVQSKYNLTRNNLKTMFKHFKLGWNPTEDQKWLEDFKENT